MAKAIVHLGSAHSGSQAGPIKGAWPRNRGGDLPGDTGGFTIQIRLTGGELPVGVGSTSLPVPQGFDWGRLDGEGLIGASSR
jgi:hypothetical protein